MTSVHERVEMLVQNLSASGLMPEECSMVIAYENDIKPYPVTKPIVAFAVDKITIGERLVSIGEDGSQTQTKNRTVDSVIKVSFFVPYASGPETCFSLFNSLSSALMFNTTLHEAEITGFHCYDCNYVRDCGALVLESDFTLQFTAAP